MRDIVHIVVATSLVSGFYAAGCMRSADPSRERERLASSGSDDVVIAVPFPWSSRPELLFGQGLQLAVEQANAEGGVNGRKLRIRKVDDGGAIDRGRLVAQELVDDPSVVAVVGHHQSRVTAAAAPIYNLAGVVFLSATTAISDLPAQEYRYVFQMTFTGEDMARSIAKFALNRGCRRLAIYYSRDDDGRDLANAFEEFMAENGGQIVARESTDPADPTGTRGAARVVRNWHGQLIDAIFLATPHKAAANLAVELRKSGFHGLLFGNDALAAQGFIATGGAAVEGTVFATAFSPDSPSPETQQFTHMFERRFETEPSLTAALGYDAAGLLVHAMREAGSVFPSAVAAALRGVRDLPGVTGVFTFGDAGGLIDPAVKTAIIRNGHAHALVDPTAAPTCSAGAETAAKGF